MEHDGRDGESSAKRLKPNEEEEEGDNRDQMAVANVADDGEGENIADANDDSSPSIFKLDIDCCEELFAYLPLEDLYSLGQTCKRMHQFTGYFVREKYKSTEFRWRNGNLYFNESKMNGFIEFISYLRIESNQLERFPEFAPRFKSIRSVYLYLLDDQIDCIKEILYKCEEIHICFNRNVLNIDLYENILKFCTNLKHFKLNSSRFDYGLLKNNNWLLHEYPNLESVDLYSTSFTMQSMDEVRTFFTLNKGIRNFRTNFSSLWNCRHWILDTDIKLDELSVDCVCTAVNGFNTERINLLNMLYERGFYKHLSLLEVIRYDSSILAKIRAPLTIESYVTDSPLPPLDLKVIKYRGTRNLETILANNLSTIEQIYCPSLNTKNILFFIRNCMKLRKIKIDLVFDLNPLNLAQLNQERKKLVGASSVTIYLEKRDYYATINTTGLDLIKTKILKLNISIFQI